MHKAIISALDARQHVERLQDLIEKKRSRALRLRNSDNTANGERLAQGHEDDAAAIRVPDV